MQDGTESPVTVTKVLLKMRSRPAVMPDAVSVPFEESRSISPKQTIPIPGKYNGTRPQQIQLVFDTECKNALVSNRALILDAYLASYLRVTTPISMKPIRVCGIGSKDCVGSTAASIFSTSLASRGLYQIVLRWGFPVFLLFCMRDLYLFLQQFAKDSHSCWKPR